MKAFANENSGIPTGAHPSILFDTTTMPDWSSTFTVIGANPFLSQQEMTQEAILSAVSQLRVGA